MTLIKRSTKGSALTFDELDGNFTHLGHDGTYHSAGVRIGPPGTVLEMLAGHAKVAEAEGLVAARSNGRRSESAQPQARADRSS